MLGLARFAMKSPVRAGILAAIFAAVPMLYIFSAALVALTTLRYGLSQGTRLLVAAMIGGVVSWQMSGIPLSLLLLPLVALLAAILRSTQRWSVTLVLGSVVAMLVAIVLQSVALPQLQSAVDFVQRALMGDTSDQAVAQVFDALKQTVGYLVMTTQLIEALLLLMLGRYWQAGLDNPGGLRAELHNLKFSKQEIMALVALIVVSWLFVPAAIMLFSIPLVFAGMALIHGGIAKANLGGQWLAMFYVALLLLNQIIIPLLVFAAVVDAIVDFRSKLPNR